MKLKNLPTIFTALLAVAILSLSSCHKRDMVKDDEDNDTSEASEQSFAENVSSDILNIGSQATDNNGSFVSYKAAGAEETLGSCATIKRDSIRRIDSVIFNNSSCIDGRVRNGVLVFNYSASAAGAKHYRDPGFKCSVTSSGYTVDDRSVNIISKTIENTTPSDFNPATTNLSWKITGHIEVTKTGVGTHDFSYTRFKTLLNTSDANVYHGAPTPISWNLARIGITGEASGTTAKGRSFTATVTSQLVRDFGGCTIGKRHPFIQGIMNFTPGDRPTRSIDFGSGSCDLDATVTIRNKTYNITLQ